ncbi:ATP-binding protein [Pontibacter qinzhouensis]|nr:sensor histidine kinase [Pontibacter qinzhouensis]
MVLVVAIPAHCQEASEVRYTDSLLQLLETAPTNSAKIDHLLELSNFWSDRDTTRAFSYVRRAEKLMGSRPGNYQKALLEHFTSNIIFAHHIERAKAGYMAAEKLLSSEKTPQAYTIRSKAWNNYGILLQLQDSASKYLTITINRALPYARMAGDSVLVGNYLHNIGLMLMNVQDYHKADTYYQKALLTFSKLPGAYENKLEVLVNRSRNALFLKQYDVAWANLQQAATQLTYVPHSTLAAAFYRTQGTYFRHIRQKDKAIRSFQKGLERAVALKDGYATQDIYFELYATYRDFEEYSQAKKYLLQANQYAALNTAHNRLLLQRELALVEYKLGHYQEAYKQLEVYALAKDTFQEENMALKILDLEKRYESVEKQNEILKLRDENQKQELAIVHIRWWTYGLGGGLLLALTIACFSWMLVERNRKLMVQKEQLYQEELRSMKQRERLKQYDAVLRGQEQERNRMARDLHDGLGGLLAGIKLKLSAIVSSKEQVLAKDKPDMLEVVEQLDFSVDELRRISRNLMPESLLLMGLEPALADLCMFMDTPQTAVRFQPLDIGKSYPKPLLVAIYRIVQELLTNAVKHACASEVIVQCSQLEEVFFLTVEDNGKGMPTSPDAPAQGLGLSNIRNRVALLNGSLEILSQPNQGTSFNIQIPL